MKKFLLSLLVISSFMSVNVFADVVQKGTTRVAINDHFRYDNSNNEYVNELFGEYLYRCNIDGYNYFRLRDIAALLNGTDIQFDVKWNPQLNQIEIFTKTPFSDASWSTTPDYEVDIYDGEDLSPIIHDAQPSNIKILVDGVETELKVYNIDDTTYFKISDLANIIGFKADWNEFQQRIDVSYNSDNKFVLSGIGEADYSLNYLVQSGIMDNSTSVYNYSDTIENYIYDNNDTTFSILKLVEAPNKVQVFTYDKQSLTKIGIKSVENSYGSFGGFLNGRNYNYMVFVQPNETEDNNKVVMTIVKYDKQFNEISKCEINGGQAVSVAFLNWGTLRMAESSDASELSINTDREYYKTKDGLNHQANFTVILDTNTMTPKNNLTQFQDTHVSHSFEQFVKYDGNKPIFVDLGDAYPRGVNISYPIDYSYNQSVIMEIDGEIGDNKTGVRLGGFEVTDTNYLTVINSAGSSSLPNSAPRDIYLLISNKSNISETRIVKITDYINKNGLSASIPRLVKINNDKYMLLWNTFSTNENDYPESRFENGVHYMYINGKGELMTKPQLDNTLKLSKDCQPIFMDDSVVWYTTSGNGDFVLQKIYVK